MSEPLQSYRFDIVQSIKTRSGAPVQGNPRRTICDVHREIYQLAHHEISNAGTARKIQRLTAEAFDMGKRMSIKLEEYNSGGFAAQGRR